MNTRSQKKWIKLAAILGASLSATTALLLAHTPNFILRFLLATLAGTAGHLVVTGLAMLLLPKIKLRQPPARGECVYAFKDLPAGEANLAGGKGRALAFLFRQGFPVPDGCVLLPAAFDGDALTPGARQRIQQQLARLRRGKPVTFAVRSSALDEDSALASFAGEFESVLDLSTDEDIFAAVQTVRASARSPRVQAYLSAKGLHPREVSVAVVIQVFIRPDFAGVLFTANPLDGDLMTMTGNFVSGTGDRLVSGQVSASQFTFSRPEGVYHGPPELRQAAKSLHAEAHEIEKALGCPQDIEWAAVGKKVYILQSRPITTLNGYNPVTAECNDTLKGTFLWSATNLMEACPDVLTPFTVSLIPYLHQHGGPTLVIKNVPINGIIAGRFYANISVQVTAFMRFFKSDTHRTYREMSGWWGEIPAGMDIPVLPLSKAEWQSEVLPALWRTTRQFARYVKTAPQYLAGNRQRCAEMREKTHLAQTKEELLALWNLEILPAYREAMLYMVAAGSDQQVRLERELRALVGPDDANALLSNLAGLAGGLESLGPLAGLGQVARGQMSREDYLENYGHRGVNEGEVAWPRPAEDPSWLDRQLEEWNRAPVDVDALQARQRAAYEAAWLRFCQKYPSKAKVMQVRIQRVARAAQLREHVRSETTRGMTVLRAFALRAGEMLGLGEDVFFLTLDEVLAALAGDTTPLAHIPLRQATHRRYCALPPYPAIICGRFDPFQWAADPDRRADLVDSRVAPATTDHTGQNIIQGAPGALGVVEGTVRCLHSIEESVSFQPGEVLVTTMTNIGWTPLFPRAAAIVTDLGAPLSHAAIVARELGIPAVVGCGSATARLKTGDRVRVDGGRGIVEILPPPGQ